MKKSSFCLKTDTLTITPSNTEDLWESDWMMQQKNRPYKRIQQVGEKNVHFKIVQGNFPEKRA